jgi:phosphoribosylaminoimidazolecarboxamide formyltransferase/IMP cyclohydrolase
MSFNSVSRADDEIRLHNVIISVYDKTGLDEFVTAMLAYCAGIRFYSTGGTYDRLAAMLGDRAGAHLVKMSDYTGQVEMKGGLVKTLDWKIYLGLLAEPYDADHAADITRSRAVCFDMVVGNLYPFGEAAAKAGRFEDARQNIDIGGPCMLRAAAKNFLRVASVAHPSLYPALIDALREGKGALTLKHRAALAQETFRRQAAYDLAIADYLAARDEGFIRASYAL